MKFLIIILIILPIHSSFAATNCGMLLNALFKYGPADKAEFVKFFPTKEKFCDPVINEENANIEIVFYGKNKLVKNRKKIFVPTETPIESYQKLELDRVASRGGMVAPQYRTLQFFYESSLKSLDHYEIFFIGKKQNEKRKIGSGSIR